MKYRFLARIIIEAATPIVIKSGEKKYWYEIELNDKDTLMGWDKDGAKVLVLWPEAVKAEESAGE